MQAHSLKISKNKRHRSTGRDELDPYLKYVTVKASIDGWHAGTLEAIEIDVPKISNLKGKEALWRLFGETDQLAHLCQFVYGMDHLALGAPWMIKERAFFSSQFRRMATSRSDFSYWPPSSGRESDLEYQICLIDNVLVEPQMRGEGVGTRLIESLGDKRTDHWKRAPIFLMLKAYPIDGAWRLMPPGSKEQHDMLKMEQGRLYGFYKSLGFIADRDSFWMMHTPKALHNDTRERHMISV